MTRTSHRIRRLHSDSEITPDDFDNACSITNESHTRRNGKHDIFAGLVSDQVLHLFIKHSKKLSRKRHQSCVLSTSLPEHTAVDFLSVSNDSAVFSRADIMPEDNDDIATVFDYSDDMPCVKTRRNPVWYMDSNFHSCVTDSPVKTLSRCKRVYNDLASMA